MRRAAKQLEPILKGILMIGFSVQAVLGLWWMCANFNESQYFPEPEGMLYPVLYRMTGEIPQIIYALQLIFGCFAGRRCLVRLLPGWRAWWGSLVLLTFPMAMQCHLAVLPHSFVASLFLLELTFAREALEEAPAGSLAKAGGCWLFLALLLPEYLYLGGVPVIFALLFLIPRYWKNRRSLSGILLIPAAFLGLILGVGSLTGQENCLSRQSISRAFFSRAVWPTIWNDHFAWPEEIREKVEDRVWSVSFNEDHVERILQPLLEESLDGEQITEFYNQAALYSWRVHGPMILRQMVWDGLGYGVTPLLLPLQLEGRGYDAHSGRNYENMRNAHPLLTRRYVEYGCWWFGMMLVLLLLLAAVKRLGQEPAKGCPANICAPEPCEDEACRPGAGEKRRKERRLWLKTTVLYLAAAGALAAGYTLRGAGRMDYKYSVAVNELWLILALLFLRKGKCGDREQVGE